MSRSDDPTAILSPHLSPGERLLWAGRPKQGLLLRGEDIWLIPFSLVWSLPTLSRLSRDLAAGTVQFDPISLLFLFTGLYLLIGRFLVDAWLRSRTYYGVTDRQALIVGHSVGSKPRSVGLQTLSDLKLTLRRGGRGTVELGRPKRSNVFGPRGTRALPFPGAMAYLPPTFEAITNPREVYDLIVQAQQHALQTP